MISLVPEIAIGAVKLWSRYLGSESQGSLPNYQTPVAEENVLSAIAACILLLTYMQVS